MNVITAAQVAAGLVISRPGIYTVTEPLVVDLPPFPTPATWAVYVEGRPCGIAVQSSDVLIDFAYQSFACSSEHVFGLALVGVAPGSANVLLRDLNFGLCGVGVLFGLGCARCAVEHGALVNFAQRGVLAYSPQGLLLTDLVVGPNLSQLAESQESFALACYGDYVTPAGKQGWQNFPDNLPLQEESAVAGVAVVPSAAADAPRQPLTNTGADVVLERVQVLQLSMVFRQHSVLASLFRGNALPLRQAAGRLGEPLPDWYRLRWYGSLDAGNVPAPLAYFPSPELCAPAPSFITDAGGFLMNTGDSPLDEQRTVQFVGVDRNGAPLCGVQALLFVGCGEPTLTAVSAVTPVLQTLTPRLLPVLCERKDLTIYARAAKLLVVPAPLTSVGCCSALGATGGVAAGANGAAQFYTSFVRDGGLPPGPWIRTARGSATVGYSNLS